jgi:signal transduction histidine kinase/CheY-like chemotaxis protein
MVSMKAEKIAFTCRLAPLSSPNIPVFSQTAGCLSAPLTNFHYNNYSHKAGKRFITPYHTTGIADMLIRERPPEMDQSTCHAIINRLSDGIVVIDVSGSITAINPAACRLLDLPDGEFNCRPAREIFRSIPDLIDTIQHPLQSERELKINHGNSDRYTTLTVQALPDEKAGQNGYLVVLRDSPGPESIESEFLRLNGNRDTERSNASKQLIQEITERDLLEQRLRQAGKMETIGRLTSGIAHDFGNLLTVILGSAELGLQEAAPGNIHRRFLDIRNGALIARDLTNRLHGLGHQESLQRKYLSLNHVISDLLNMMERVLGENIKLRVRLTPVLYPTVAAIDQMQQLIINLCAHACDSMPGGGELTISTDNLTDGTEHSRIEKIDPESSYIVIMFTCTGDIASDEMQRISDFDNINSPASETNLGMLVVQGIIQQHQGQITVSSTVTRGASIITVYLPAIPDMELIVNPDSNNNNLTGGTETILLVEDNEMVLNIAMRILDELGYKILVAHDVDEALDLFGKNLNNINLVMSDVVMPRSSGPEMFSRMRAMRPDLPAVFVTGYDVTQSMETLNLLECGENCAVLQKPYSQEALAQKIRELLGDNAA